MSEFKVNFGAVGQAGADIKGAGKVLESRLDELDRQLAPLRSDWTGAASEAYTQAKDQWTKAITNMQQLLNEIGGAVESSGGSYQDSEKSTSNLWS